MSKQHEQLLFRYSSALERGDFETVADVLRQAERDPALEQMILDMNDAYSAERFNHTNLKENPMIAALYQNRKPARPRVHWQGLPFVAALAVIALLSVLLAVQTRGNIPVNSGGNNPLAAVAQISPYCTGTLISTFATVPLYSRPASDAPVVAELQRDHNAGREIVVLDRVSAEGEAWVFVRVPASPDVPFGWLTEAQFRTMVADCQPTVVPVEAVVQASATATPVPGIAQHPLLVVTYDMNATVVLPVVTATPVPAIAQHPLFVVTPPSADALITVIPANVMPLPTFTPTPELQIIEATALPLEDAVEYGVSIAATDLARFGEGGFCKMITLTSAEVRAFPEWDGAIVATLPGDTLVSIGSFATSTDPQGNPLRWYVVGFQDIRGWMSASQLDASLCPASFGISAESPATQAAETHLYMTATAMIQKATAATPTSIYVATQPPLVIPPFVATDGEGNVVYIVQDGDTLLSILMRLGLDPVILPDVLRLNALTTSSARLQPGSVLRIPWTLSATVTICRVNAGQELEIWAQPTADAARIATFGEGTEFQVVNLDAQPEQTSLMINAQLDGVTINGVWIDRAALEVTSDCGVVLPLSGDAAVVPLVLTATLMPPPILTATPIPVTLVPLITTTPPPTPTLAP